MYVVIVNDLVEHQCDDVEEAVQFATDYATAAPKGYVAIAKFIGVVEVVSNVQYKSLE